MNRHLRAPLSLVVGVLLVVGLVPAIAAAQPPSPEEKELTINRRSVGGPPDGTFRGPAKGTEIPRLRTRTSRTLQNPWGALETEIFMQSIHYQHDGRWKEIDNSLAPAEGGAAYENRANRFTARLPKVLGAAPVRFSLGTDFVSLDLQGAAPVRAVVNGDRAAYADAFPGVDVSYRVLADSLEDELALESADARSEFTWKLQHSPALTAAEDGVGGLRFTNAGGEAVFAVAPPTIVDAANTSSPQHVFKLTPGAGFSTVALSVDEDWLDAPERQFPVTIDPEVVIGQKDCYVADGNLSNNTFCGFSTIQVGRSFDGYRNRALLRFDVAQFPDDAEVLDAKLSLNLTQYSSGMQTNIEAKKLTKPFIDGWATWDSPTGASSNPWSGGEWSNKDSFTNDRFELWTGMKYWYITRMVKDWIAKGHDDNDGVILKAEDESVSQLLKFSSVESNNPPSLTVTWDRAGMGSLSYYRTEDKKLNDRRQQRVNVAGGNLLIHESDFKIKGTGLDLVFNRYYNSMVKNEVPVTRAFPTTSPSLGSGWSLSEGGDVGLKLFQDNLAIAGKGSSEPARGAVFFGPSGYRLPFVKERTTGVFLRPRGLNADLRLNDTTGNYVLTMRGNEEQYVFSNGGILLLHRDKNGNKIEYSYDSNNRLASLTDTQGRVTTFTYNTNGMLTSVKDPANRTHQFGFTDSLDPRLLTKYTDAVGYVTTYGYDSNKRLTSITDAEGRKTLYEYNSDNAVTKVTYVTNTIVNPPAGDSTTYTYTASNTTRCPERTNQSRQIRQADMPFATESTNARGYTTTYCYNDLGQVRLVKDAKGNKVYASYTATANVESYIDAFDNEFLFSYDQSGNLSGTSGFQTGTSSRSTTTAAYEDDRHKGFPTLLTDAQGNKTKLVYDAPGNVTKVTLGFESASPVVFEYVYDARGNVTRIKTPPQSGGSITQADADRNDIVIGYDTAGNMSWINYPMITHPWTYPVAAGFGDVSFHYDGLSRLKSIIDGEAGATNFSYGDNDRIYHTEMRPYAGSTLTVWHGFDKVGNVTSRNYYLGTQATHSAFQYDSKNQLVKETHTGASDSTYSWDRVGNLLNITKGGEITQYSYDSVDLLEKITEPGGAETTFTYWPSHQRKTVTYPNLVQVRTDPTASGDVKSIVATKSNGTTIVDLLYTYADASNKDRALLQKVTDRRTNVTTSYTYDPLNRLKKAVSSAGQEWAYTYDEMSNLKTVTRPGEDKVLTYGDVNELKCIRAVSETCESAGAVKYYYDGRGGIRESSKGLLAGYASRYHMTSFRRNSSTPYSFFAYRDSTQEESIQIGSSMLQRDFLGVERESAATYLRDSNGEQLGLRTGTAKRYFIKDRLGSVVAATNASGDAVQRTDYDPYGKMTEVVTDNVHQPWRYAGSYSHAETGLYQMGQRWYDPTQMRFTQMDPKLGELKDPLTLNPYLYAAGDPVNQFDPSGRCSEEVSGDLIELGAGLVFAGLSLIGSPVTGGTSIVGLVGGLSLALYQGIEIMEAC
jgi:RHS repeat-associated protein